MKSVTNLFLFIFLGALEIAYAQQPLLHFPSVNPDGTKIVFNYQGDI